MPGLSIYNFGSPIHFNANYSTEVKKDLSKVNFDNERYTHGFLQGAQVGIAKAKLGYLLWGTKLMTRE